MSIVDKLKKDDVYLPDWLTPPFWIGLLVCLIAHDQLSQLMRMTPTYFIWLFEGVVYSAIGLSARRYQYTVVSNFMLGMSALALTICLYQMFGELSYSFWQLVYILCGLMMIVWGVIIASSPFVILGGWSLLHQIYHQFAPKTNSSHWIEYLIFFSIFVLCIYLIRLFKKNYKMFQNELRRMLPDQVRSILGV